MCTFRLQDAIWLHIRACGEWTSRLFEYFEKEQEKLKCYSDNIARAKRRTKMSVKSTSMPEESKTYYLKITNNTCIKCILNIM